MSEIVFIRVPYEGCDWEEMEALSPQAFIEALATEPKPCALGWIYGVDENGIPDALVYDYVIERFNRIRGDGICPWRSIPPKGWPKDRVRCRFDMATRRFWIAA